MISQSDMNAASTLTGCFLLCVVGALGLGGLFLYVVYHFLTKVW